MKPFNKVNAKDKATSMPDLQVRKEQTKTLLLLTTSGIELLNFLDRK